MKNKIKQIINTIILSVLTLAFVIVPVMAADGVTTITFTNSPSTIDISGTKTWEDENNEYSLRPGSITVHLLADGTEVDSATVTEQDEWTYTFTDLPKYNNDGNEIVYTITEDGVDNYETEISEYDITNTLKVFNFILQKTDGNEKPLNEAVFTVKDSSENQAYFTKDDDSYTRCNSDTDGAVTEIELGNTEIKAMPAGTYTLTETKAPTGYNPLIETITITVNEDGTVTTTGNSSIVTVDNNTEDEIPVVTVYNTAGDKLPETGGTGTLPFILIGFILMLSSGIFLYRRKYKN